VKAQMARRRLVRWPNGEYFLEAFERHDAGLDLTRRERLDLIVGWTFIALGILIAICAVSVVAAGT
jgi:hypothetical protein